MNIEYTAHLHTQHPHILNYKRLTNLVIVGVVQIFLILFVLFHLVPNCPLTRGRMAVIYRVVRIPSGTNIGPGGKSSSTEWVQEIEVGLADTLKGQQDQVVLKHNCVLLNQ